jgi:hypothetical protein
MNIDVASTLKRIRTKTNKTCKGRNMNDVDVTNKLTANKVKFLIFDNHKKNRNLQHFMLLLT